MNFPLTIFYLPSLMPIAIKQHHKITSNSIIKQFLYKKSG